MDTQEEDVREWPVLSFNGKDFCETLKSHSDKQ